MNEPPKPDEGRVGGLSQQVISRHMPSSSVGEVLPGLYVGNLMSVSHLGDLAKRNEGDRSEKTLITVISVLSNENLIRFATDALEKQRIQNAAMSRDGGLDFEINHVVIPLKDTVQSDLLSTLPGALEAMDTALGDGTGDANSNNPQRICLVHCARGASRSVSLIMAYLMSRHSNRFKTFDEALQHVRSVRPQATPNIGFALALRQFERQLNQENT